MTLLSRYVLAVALLTIVYALALASFHPWDLVFGAVLSGVLVFVSRDFVFGGTGSGGEIPLPRRVLAFFPFCAVVFKEIVIGTRDVALVTLHLRPLVQPGIVAVPIGERTVTGLAVWAVVTGLPPGSFFVDIDRERDVALIHVLDARNPEAFREQQERFYRLYQSRVFP